jgi:hypothetical protein
MGFLSIPTDGTSGKPLRRAAPAFFAAAFLLCGGIVLSACSREPADGVGTEPGTPGPVDASGVYPLPEPGTAAPRSLPHAEGTNSVFLPAVINEKSPLYPFELQQTGVMPIQGFFGCDWTGVAGQIFDPTGDPIQNLIVHLEGFWNGSSVSTEVLSGTAPQYGPAGYEFLLGSQPLNSSQALWVQLRDATNKQISARVYFNTYNDCARNLILINFVEILR